ncbi:hypothetical protein [Ekhidna sp.]|uniref:hypothetical protein n=1 Tax=Ekhidna sp. TaxID=2608089 RepID=UPI003B5C2084
MKRLSNLLAALVFASLVIFMSCGGGGGNDGPTVVEEKTELLSQQWSVNASKVTYDGGPEGDWSGFTLTFTANGNYSTNGVPTGYEDVWPSNGSWEFTDNQASAIQRDGNNGITMDYTVNNQGTSLSLEFTVPDPNARTSGLYDEPWLFEFSN